MLKRIPVIAALTGLALTGALCACGSAAQPGRPAQRGRGSGREHAVIQGHARHAVVAWPEQLPGAGLRRAGHLRGPAR